MEITGGGRLSGPKVPSLPAEIVRVAGGARCVRECQWLHLGGLEGPLEDSFSDVPESRSQAIGPWLPKLHSSKCAPGTQAGESIPCCDPIFIAKTCPPKVSETRQAQRIKSGRPEFRFGTCRRQKALHLRIEIVEAEGVRTSLDSLKVVVNMGETG